MLNRRDLSRSIRKQGLPRRPLPDVIDRRSQTDGWRLVHSQENNPFVLPNSKIPGSVSSEYYKFQEEDTPGVFPDVEIPFRWKEYANAEDPVIAYLYDRLK